MIYFTSLCFLYLFTWKMLTSFTWFKFFHYICYVIILKKAIHSNVLQGPGNMMGGFGMFLCDEGWGELWSAVLWTWQCHCNDEHTAAVGLHRSDFEEWCQQQWEGRGKREGSGWWMWSNMLFTRTKLTNKQTTPLKAL